MPSFVLIKVSKCGTETVKKMIEKNVDKNLILDAPYESIFQYEDKQFKYSINHINYDNYFIHHLEKIMKDNIKYIGFVRNPIDRLISHFYFSNNYRNEMTFDEWYTCDSTRNEGWSGGCKNSKNSRDCTDNFMSKYLGFTSLEEITKQNIKNAYHFIVRLEDTDKYKKLIEILNLNVDDNFKIFNVSKNYDENKLYISEKTKKIFEKNNKMDLKLYKLVCEIY